MVPIQAAMLQLNVQDSKGKPLSTDGVLFYVSTCAFNPSKYACFCSFSKVVLFLKVLLSQHDLDKPFTGGLGSFKLYVLVASHVSTVKQTVEVNCRG